MMLTNAPRAQQRGARRKYATAKALAHAHSTNPLLWQPERRCIESVPNQLIVGALKLRTVSTGLAALAGSRGLAFEFWDRLRTRPDAGGHIAAAFLEGALATASQRQGIYLPLGVRELYWWASVLHQEPRWQAALAGVTQHEQLKIHSWATSKDRLIKHLSSANAARMVRFFLALLNLAEDNREAGALRIHCLQALDEVYEYVPNVLIQAVPIGLLREAYPTVKTQLTAEKLLARPEVLSDRPWVIQILDAHEHGEDMAATLPALALRAFSGKKALTEARDLFQQLVQPSQHATMSFTTALVFEEPKLRRMLTPAIIATCLSVEPSEEAREWLLKELAGFNRQVA